MAELNRADVLLHLWFTLINTLNVLLLFGGDEEFFLVARLFHRFVCPPHCPQSFSIIMHKDLNLPELLMFDVAAPTVLSCVGAMKKNERFFLKQRSQQMMTSFNCIHFSAKRVTWQSILRNVNIKNALKV